MQASSIAGCLLRTVGDPELAAVVDRVKRVSWGSANKKMVTKVGFTFSDAWLGLCAASKAVHLTPFGRALCVLVVALAKIDSAWRPTTQAGPWEMLRWPSCALLSSSSQG